MGDKHINKELHELAAKLPMIFAESKEYGSYSGTELIEMGYEKDRAGNQLSAELLYHLELPVKMACNHYRRLKKAYKANGMKGVNHYLSNLDRIITPQIKNDPTGI